MMKKYWVTIVIAVVMIASIGTFYIQSVFAANNKSELTIEKIEGDEKEVDSLLFTGFYYDVLTYVGEEFEIGLEGTKYLEDSSFFERVEGVYGSPRIKQLQKDYRHFMRGKYSNINAYFENEDFLTYANVSHKNPYTMSSKFEFDIAVLDKQTNKVNSFEHLVPNSSDFWYLDPLKIQVIDGQLKIMTQNDMREYNGQEIHLYTFDLEKKALLNDEVILSTENKTDEHIEISTLQMDNSTRESTYTVFIKRGTKVNEDGFMEEVTEEEVIIYDLTSNTSKVINLEDLSEYSYPEYVDRSSVYFTEIGEDDVLKISVYDIERDQIIESFDVELSNSSAGKNIRLNEGKLYVVDSYTDFKTSSSITVIHLENGKILFEGKITPEDQKGRSDKVGWDIYGIQFN